MRDILCDDQDCREGKEIYKKNKSEKREEIKELKEDIKKGIQRKPRDNKSIIKARHYRKFEYYLDNARAHYSLGDSMNELNEGYTEAVQDLEKSEKER